FHQKNASTRFQPWIESWQSECHVKCCGMSESCGGCVRYRDFCVRFYRLAVTAQKVFGILTKSRLFRLSLGDFLKAYLLPGLDPLHPRRFRRPVDELDRASPQCTHPDGR